MEEGGRGTCGEGGGERGKGGMDGRGVREGWTGVNSFISIVTFML